MTQPDILQRLRPWLNKPTNAAPIQAFVEDSEKPLTVAEIAKGTGIPKLRCASVLGRLCEKGLLVRRKAPMSYMDKWGNTRTIQTFLYYPAGSK